MNHLRIDGVFTRILPVIDCVQIQHPNGEVVWTSKNDYESNPTPGTYIVSGRPSRMTEDNLPSNS